VFDNKMSAKQLFFQLFSIKYGALALLVLQNTFLVVFMHYSRVTEGPMYASSTAVASMEVLKFVTCLFVVAYQRGGVVGLYNNLRDELLAQPMELVKLSVPSLLYTVQNNLLYYALSHLDAATFQVGYQVKILTTAVFSVFMLGKRLSYMQWISLIILTIGVSMAQLSTAGSDSTKANTTSGFIAVLLAACTSGFSGVYFERILKNSGTSLWVRNIQMGISSIILGVAGIYFSGDASSVQANGFFYGYNSIVISVILLQAVGGLVVAVVVKYADNILKGFAASFSIVTSCILSYFMFDFHPTLLFLIGAVLVNVSMYMYSYEPAKKIDKGAEGEGYSLNGGSSSSKSYHTGGNGAGSGSSSSSSAKMRSAIGGGGSSGVNSTGSASASAMERGAAAAAAGKGSAGDYEAEEEEEEEGEELPVEGLEGSGGRGGSNSAGVGMRMNVAEKEY
jgi:solute carrier family 35 (UDP-sugar transporter), member A1/2/3